MSVPGQWRLPQSIALGSRVSSCSKASAMCISPCLPQTGKSYTLEHVVPAVVAEALCKQQRAEQQAKQQQQQQQLVDRAEDGLLAGMMVLRLRGDQLDRSVRLHRRMGVCQPS